MRVPAKPWPTGEWRRLLAEAVADPDELLRLLGLDGRAPSATPDAARRFPLRVPRGFVARMRRGDPDDPLLRQVLPDRAEDVPAPGFTADPVGELAAPTAAGVLHKYHGRALAVLRATGASLLNQSVLLAGINDSAEALAGLSEALFDAGVLPYHLHVLDPVAGAAHFAVVESRAVELMRELAARLPGYLVPRLVREVPGAPAKVGIDLWA